MESPGYYWDLFLALQAQRLLEFRDQVSVLASYLHWTSAIQVMAVLHAIEYVLPWHPSQPKRRPGLGLDFFWMLCNTVLIYVLFLAAAIDTGLTAFHHVLYRFTGITDLRVVSLEELPTWAGLVLLFVFSDLLAWAGHWLLHRSDFLWQFHKVHHSSTQLDVWNAQRFHFGENVFWTFFLYVPMWAIGFPADSLLIVWLTGTLLSNFTHANIRVPLGPLRFVINHPQMHVWHHARETDAKRNCNYGDALCIFDYLFGTAYVPQGREPKELGFDGIETYPTTIRGQLVAPFVGLLHGFRRKASGAGA